MLNGTTYSVRPRIAPANLSCRTSRISAGSRQLLVGPASSSDSRADERAVLDARDVARVAARQVRVRPLGVRELLERPRLHELGAQRVVLLRRAVAPVDRRRLRELRHLLDPGEELLVFRGDGGFDGHGRLRPLSGSAGFARALQTWLRERRRIDARECERAKTTTPPARSLRERYPERHQTNARSL